ncbi:unnamed protein product [Scytosiphon promiscuus]
MAMNTASSGGFHGGGGGGGVDAEEGGPVKENTGRWTYDEHRLFLRGLELHGKGWKKIASLIKTRTVVQIRTHAQKYFQKIAKAKQNGDHGEVAMDSKGNSSRRKSRGRRRMEDLLRGSTAVAPSLQPYVAGAGAVETGLYRFLSPVTIQDVERPPTAGHGAGTGGVGGAAAGIGGNGGASLSSQLGGHASFAASPGTTHAAAAAAEVLPPNWYRAGRGVDDLLNEAEGLDWLADSGGAGGPAAAAAAAAAASAAVAAAAASVSAPAGASNAALTQAGVARIAPPSEFSSEPLLKKVRPASTAEAISASTPPTLAGGGDGMDEDGVVDEDAFVDALLDA